MTRNRITLSKGQRGAQRELRRIASEHPEALQLVEELGLDSDGVLEVRVRLPTGQLPRGKGGLRLRDHEDVVLRVLPAFPLLPPRARVDHFRFAGHPHVLLGRVLCVLLDESREWDPKLDVVGFLERLWRWFDDAAAGRFDAADALFHPVGGVQSRTPGTPIVVVRESFDSRGTWFRRGRLRQRTPQRLDFHWQTPGDGDHATVAIALENPLFFGASPDLAEFLFTLDHPKPETVTARKLHRGWPRSASVLDVLATTALRNSDGTPLYFVCAVPNPATGAHHLLVGRLPAEVSDALRRVARGRKVWETLDSSAVPIGMPIEWCYVSDERPEITTRRDDSRPVNAFTGKNVHLWGCGGIGSWVAEFVARAEPATITLCDPAPVVGGLLVRQNYTEADIGTPKAEALAARLRSINDRVAVNPAGSPYPDADDTLWDDADVVIDCTVNVSLGRHLDTVLENRDQAPIAAQLAVDVATGSLGVMSVSAPEYGAGPRTVDEATAKAVLADSSLEAFHCLWQDPTSGDEITPAQGCSVPTFHGSSADLAAVAATLVNFLGLQLKAPSTGTHLVALPHAASESTSQRFVPIDQTA